MRKRAWLRSIENRNDLLAWLVVFSLATLAASRPIQDVNPWLSNLLLSLATSFITFIVAIVLVDGVVRQIERRLEAAEAKARQEQEEAQWATVNHHVGFYVQNVARRCALAYRIGVGIGDQSIPNGVRDQTISDTEQLQNTIEWFEQTIIPALPNLQRRTAKEWQEVVAVLHEASAEAENALLLFGDRLKPEIYTQLLAVHRQITRSIQSYEMFQAVLGIPNEQVVVTPDMHISTMFEIGVLKHQRPIPVVIDAVRDGALEDAADEGEKLLNCAIRLLQETTALLPKEERKAASDDERATEPTPTDAST
jgi:hypothetical protein